MRRLTKKNGIFFCGYEPRCEINEAFFKLGRLEDIEEKLGIDLMTLPTALKNGIYDKEGKFHKQVYLCFIDGEWTIADMQTDCWYPVSEYGRSWALTKDELNK